jgi:hypothetical protein
MSENLEYALPLVRFGLWRGTGFERSRFAADAVACPNRTASEIRDKSLEELSVSRYDEAIVSLGFIVGSMNFDLKVPPQVLFFPTISRPKSIEIP